MKSACTSIFYIYSYKKEINSTKFIFNRLNKKILFNFFDIFSANKHINEGWLERGRSCLVF